MTLAVRVLIGLVAGFLLGLALAGSASPGAASVISVLVTVGMLFVNLIRMTVIPLIASMLVAGIGAMPAWRGLGRLGVRGLAVSVVLLATASAGSVLVAVPVLARVQIDATAAIAVRHSISAGASAGSVSSGAPTLGGWFAELIPANVFKAAADGAMLPIIVFAVLFGVALTRVGHSRRDAVLRVVEGIAEARCSSSCSGFSNWRRSGCLPSPFRWRHGWARGGWRHARLHRPRGAADCRLDGVTAVSTRRDRHTALAAGLRRLLRTGAGDRVCLAVVTRVASGDGRQRRPCRTATGGQSRHDAVCDGGLPFRRGASRRRSA